MQVIIKLKEEGLQGAEAEVADVLASLGCRASPLFPGAEEKRLALYLQAEASDAASARDVVARLQGMPQVEAAYLKPEDELP